MHIPVLQKEVIWYLNPKPNENFIDCTIGEGGHTSAIIEKIWPNGKVLGIDWSTELIEGLKIKYRVSIYGNEGEEENEILFAHQKSKIKNNLILVCDNFANLKKLVEKYKFGPVSGILFDLGMSSWHLEESEKGFSFQKKEHLDMRYNPQNPLTAEKILNYWSALEIEKILKDCGEEKFAKRITKKIIEERKNSPIKTTFQLVEIIKKSVPKNYEMGRINPATRTFQALRIAVNDELSNLKKTLPQVLNVLRAGGRLVIISFHSLEDRIVKNFFKENLQKNLLRILTNKPIAPREEEIKINPRSRSAKLRAAIKK